MDFCSQFDRCFTPPGRFGNTQSYRKGQAIIAIFLPVNADGRTHTECPRFTHVEKYGCGPGLMVAYIMDD